MGSCCSSAVPAMYNDPVIRELQDLIRDLARETAQEARRREPHDNSNNSAGGGSAKKNAVLNKIITLIGKAAKDGLTYPSRAANILNQAGEREYHLGAYDAAEVLFDGALKVLQKYGIGHADVLKSLNAYDWTIVQATTLEESQVIHKEELLKEDDKPDDGDNPHFAVALNNRAWALKHMGPSRAQEALEKQKEALDMTRRFVNDGDGASAEGHMLALCMHDRGKFLEDLGERSARHQEVALEYYKKSMDMYRSLFRRSGDHMRLAWAIEEHAKALIRAGRGTPEGVALIEEAERMRERLHEQGGRSRSGGFLCKRCGTINSVSATSAAAAAASAVAAASAPAAPLSGAQGSGYGAGAGAGAGAAAATTTQHYQQRPHAESLSSAVVVPRPQPLSEMPRVGSGLLSSHASGAGSRDFSEPMAVPPTRAAPPSASAHHHDDGDDFDL